MKRILVTGGAGYIGSVLTRLLLTEGYAVRVLDDLRFGGDSLVELLNNPVFEFMRGDVRDPSILTAALANVDAVVHLAAIVGDPACSKQPEEAKSINLEATKQCFQLAASQELISNFIFASTCSNYGKMDNPNDLVDENSRLSPVSLYAETKVGVEEYLLSQDIGSNCATTVLRFSTVYGLSPRLRFDLTVNEFTKELALGRELEIFGEQFWRPYCHVIDLSRSVLHVLAADRMKIASNVFNVGSTEENYTKRMLADRICALVPDAKVKYVQKNEDPRDYRVSFDKISSVLGFQTTKSVQDGIEQILLAVSQGLISDPDSAAYRNI